MDLISLLHSTQKRGQWSSQNERVGVVKIGHRMSLSLVSLCIPACTSSLCFCVFALLSVHLSSSLCLCPSACLYPFVSLYLSMVVAFADDDRGGSIK